jgi:hypothetical protein
MTTRENIFFFILFFISNPNSTYPRITSAAVKYADIAWSCSDSRPYEWPNASHAGPKLRHNDVAFLKNKSRRI